MKRIKCKFCDSTFAFSSGRREHELKFHVDKVPPPKPKKPRKEPQAPILSTAKALLKPEPLFILPEKACFPLPTLCHVSSSANLTNLKMQHGEDTHVSGTKLSSLLNSEDFFFDIFRFRQTPNISIHRSLCRPHHRQNSL